MTERFSVAQGISLTVCTTDRFKTGYFSINFLRPLCKREAAANALLAGVLMRGTEKYPDLLSLSCALDELYGCDLGTLIRKKGETQCIGFCADFLDDDFTEQEPVFSETLKMLREILRNPAKENNAFRADYTEQEKENLINTIEGKINSKRLYATSQMLKNMCAGEAFGIDKLGAKEDVAEITPQSLFAHYEKVISSSPVEIIYIGARPAKQVLSCVCENFGDFPRGELVRPSTDLKFSVKEVKRVEESLNVTQGKLVMGFRVGHTGREDDWYKFIAMNFVFGCGVTSKLFLNVREKMSLCYYASASIEKFKGLMVVSSGIDFDKKEKTENAVLEQLEACRNGEISEEELSSAKKQMISIQKTVTETPENLEEFYLGQILLGRGFDPLLLAEKIETLTAREISLCAKELKLDTVYFLKGAEK